VHAYSRTAAAKKSKSAHNVPRWLMCTAGRLDAGIMLIETKSLSKRYPGKHENVVNDVNLTFKPYKTVGIFGDSGCGKSTIGYMLAGILKPTAGEIYFDEKPIKYPFKGIPRRKIQILFQHPEISFNPKFRLVTSLKEPYTFYHMPFSISILCDFLQQFGIYKEHLGRYPSELSGGELQRLALARILLVRPDFIVLDEPTSMLDVISQAQIMNLLKSLQQKQGLSYLFVSHDLSLCKTFCDKIYLLKDGYLTSHSPFF
jgi:ABC-type dipeptide/oligopeptide/nickel transport system ATPase subunit